MRVFHLFVKGSDSVRQTWIYYWSSNEDITLRFLVFSSLLLYWYIQKSHCWPFLLTLWWSSLKKVLLQNSWEKCLLRLFLFNQFFFSILGKTWFVYDTNYTLSKLYNRWWSSRVKMLMGKLQFLIPSKMMDNNIITNQ